MQNNNSKLKNLKFLALAVFLFCLFPFFVLAAPSISGVSGSASNGSQITITGSGFGANGPTIVMFDDFEGGTNGSPLELNLAPVGTWTGKYVQYAQQAIYSNDLKIGGLLSAKFDCDRQIGDDGQNPAIFVDGIPVFDSFYTSFWAVIPSGENWPGEFHPSGGNWKLTWICKTTTDADVWSPNYMRPTGNWATIGGNDWAGGNIWLDNYNLAKGIWSRFQIWVKGREDTTGQVKYWLTDSVNNTLYKISDNRATLASGDSNKRNTFYLNAYTRDDSNSHPHFDDVYFARGEYAQARVEIGNNATYANNTNLTTLTPTSWSDTSIAATVRQGSFTNGQAYLYVFDSNGNVNANGYSITIGSAPDITPPAPPTGVTII